MAAETVNYQCPACGAPLRFAGESGSVVCDHCDSSFTVAEVEQYYASKQDKQDAKAEREQQKQAQQEGTQGQDTVVAKGKAQARKNAEESVDPIQAYLQRSKWDNEESGNLKSSVCSSCGAELIHDVTTAVTQCPYCGNNSVIPGTMSGTLKPELIIPFKLTKQDAIAALKNYYKGKKFLSKVFASENHLEEIQGVYVPFWLYTGTSKARAEFGAQNVRSWRQGSYQITETDFYDIERAGTMEFKLVPVDGSQKMPDAHMDAIEPFDYSEFKEFSTAYLPGFLTDRYDLDASDCQKRAQSRMTQSSEDALRNTVVGYGLVEPRGCTVDVEWDQVSYALLPVWMLHTTWQGKDYLFAMNGQTGKLIGDLPIQGSRVAGWFFKLFIPLFAVFGAIAWLFF